MVVEIDDNLAKQLQTEFKTDNISQAIKTMFARFKHRKEYKIAEDIKTGLAQAKLHQEGKIKLKSARELLNEL